MEKIANCKVEFFFYYFRFKQIDLNLLPYYFFRKYIIIFDSRFSFFLFRRHSPMKAIAEDTTSDDDEGGHMDSSGVDDEINDILDEALDESQGSEQHISPKRSRERSSPSATSAASWEFQTPVAPSSSSAW